VCRFGYPKVQGHGRDSTYSISEDKENHLFPIKLCSREWVALDKSHLGNSVKLKLYLNRRTIEPGGGCGWTTIFHGTKCPPGTCQHQRHCEESVRMIFHLWTIKQNRSIFERTGARIEDVHIYLDPVAPHKVRWSIHINYGAQTHTNDLLSRLTTYINWQQVSEHSHTTWRKSKAFPPCLLSRSLFRYGGLAITFIQWHNHWKRKSPLFWTSHKGGTHSGKAAAPQGCQGSQLLGGHRGGSWREPGSNEWRTKGVKGSHTLT
jgi:hypothetical protein